MDPSETTLRVRCQELFQQGQQAQAAAYHWHSQFLDMEKQVDQVKRQGEQKLSQMSETNAQLHQRIVELSTEARNSANAHRVMAEAESKRTAELTEERVRRQEADRRLDDCARVVVALSMGPLEDHLASLVRICQNDALVAARDADLLRRTLQKLDKLLHSINMQATFLHSLLPERHKPAVDVRVRDLRNRVNAILTTIPEQPVKPPICGICMAPVTNFAEVWQAWIHFLLTVSSEP